MKIDSTFAMAMFYLAWTYSGLSDTSGEIRIEWIKKANDHISHLPILYQNWIRVWYAVHVSKDHDDIIKYLDLLASSDMKSRLFWWDVGTFYFHICLEYSKAAECFDKILELNKEWDDQWKFEDFYTNGDYWLAVLHPCHYADEHEKENELYRKGLELFPENFKIIFLQAACAISQDDTLKAHEYIDKFFKVRKDLDSIPFQREFLLGRMYDLAGKYDSSEYHYRRSLNINSNNYTLLHFFADMLILNGINLEEGMELNLKAMKMRPNNAFRIRTECYGYYKLGKYEEALETLSLADSLFQYWFDMASYQYRQLIEQAINDLKTQD